MAWAQNPITFCGADLTFALLLSRLLRGRQFKEKRARRKKNTRPFIFMQMEGGKIAQV